MGLPPLDGFVMGTRCGGIDPSVVTYIMDKEGFTPEQMSNLMNKKSGFLGISGISSDCRDLEQAAAEGNERAQLALDMFEYSWGQFIGRMCGSTVYNFSRGGMTAKEYVQGFGSAMGYWDPSKAAQAYIIALGCNDLFGLREEVGSLDDVHDDDPSRNTDNFAGWMGRLIARYKEISPDAKFFLMTMPLETEDQDELRLAQGRLMYAFAEHYTNTYVLDFAKYMPRYDEKMHERFFMEGHLTPAGYLLTGRLVAAYIDYIIRRNLHDFDRVGLINKEYSDSGIKKMFGL